MATQGRRGGPRRTAGSTSGAAAPAPEPPPVLQAATVIVDPGAELLDDVSSRIAPRRLGGSLGRSLPGAVVGVLLVAGLAFGAALGQTASRDTTTAANDTTAGHGGDDGEGGDDGDGKEYGGDATPKPESPDATQKPDVEHPDATPKPEHPDATDKPDVEPTQKPHEPDPTPKPTQKPDATKPPVDAIALALVIKEYHPFMEWGSCEGLDFTYYKVVRSMDSTVTWPPSDHDTTFAVVEPGGTRKAYDKDAPHGHKAWYRVFCVRKTDAGYKVLNASATKGIEVPEEPTPPDPISLGIDWSITGEGKVVLTWDACEVDGFGFYKVVKSTWNDDPSYLPWTDGTQVIGVVESMSATEWHDWAPDAGHTAWYRVQCLGYVGDMKVLLGQTAVVAVTTPES
jgi:hypothetical protein